MKEDKEITFNKIKDKVMRFLIVALRFLLKIIGLLLGLAFLVLPFLHNFIKKNIGQVLWGLSCMFFVISYFTIWKNNRNKDKMSINELFLNIGFIPIMVIFSSAFIINYYDTNYNWLWTIFTLAFIFVPVLFFSLRNYILNQSEICDKQKIISVKSCWKYVFFYWLIDLFYMTIFNYWADSSLIDSNWLYSQFILGGITMVFIFYNLSKAFLSTNKKNWLGLISDFILGIAITIYLIFIIPNQSLQSIVLTVVAAVYGGLLTLVGVAWTIKDTNDKRQEDLKRVEIERKEDERKRHIPYLRLSVNNEPNIIVNAFITSGINLGNPEDFKLLKGNYFYSINIKDFDIKNVSKENIILKGIIVNDKHYCFKTEEIIEPNEYCRVKTTNNWCIPVYDLENKLVLIVSDFLGNIYEIDCIISYKAELSSCTMVTDTEEEYTAFSYSYIVSSIDLPKLKITE